MLLLLLLVALPAAGLIYQTVGAIRDAQRFPPTGELIRAGSTNLHINQIGAGSPSVILEAGIAGTSLSWALVQPKLGELVATGSYDRAGLGWSDAVPGIRTLARIVDELRCLLAQSRLAPPYILVGHSFGGLVVRAYAAAHPEQVAGVVLVDPVSVAGWTQCPSAELARLALGARLSRRGGWLARFGVVRAALTSLAAGSRIVPKLVGRTTAGRGASVVERLVGEVRRLPPALWPVVQAHWSKPKCFQAMAGYLECLPESAKAALRITLKPEIAVRILSAGNATPVELEERERWANESRGGSHVRLESCRHWIPLERPEAVIAAVEELLAELKVNAE